jgi:hypothetical protein
MGYRTRTYIAGDWTGDQNLIRKLYEWNDNNNLKLHFIDAHDLTQARDTSLYCSIKKSLSERLDVSKTFILVVGADTAKLTKGSCKYCRSYDSYYESCHRGGHVDFRSYIQYECEKAKRDGLKIVVIYNYANVDKSKCPDVLKNVGTHLNAYFYRDGKSYWNYQKIREAIEE